MNFKSSLIKPAHTSVVDYEPTPIHEIENSCCIQCKEPYNPARMTIWARLPDGRLIWWHGRINNYDGEPCKYFATPKNDNKSQDPYKKFEKIREKHFKYKQKYDRRKNQQI